MNRFLVPVFALSVGLTGADRGFSKARKGITMKLQRRRFLQLTTGGVGLLALPRAASALDYPARPVHVIVGYPAGNSPDIIARLVAGRLSERLGRQFIIENRPGASGAIANEIAARASPDGYTVLMVTTAHAINATLYKGAKFDLIRDMAPVASIGRNAFVMVANPSLPAKTIAEFIAYAKANPRKINFASPGNGSSPHLLGELFAMMGGVELVHIPYRASFMPDLLGGQVQVVFSPVPLALEYIRTGRLRALGVSAANRLDVLPGVPAIDEFLPGYEGVGFYGIGAPAGISADTVATLNDTIRAALTDPNTKARLVSLGVQPVAMTPAEFGKLVADETQKWAKVIEFAGVRAE
jgi:tripartite-type tricarboxylate transporter receptor subunit TctC